MHRGRQILKMAVLLFVAVGTSAADRQTPSGLPVPRYVSLKFSEVNARAGPNNDQRLLWIYRARGLPVQVVAESSEWRRVCDPEGNLAWVHARTVDGRRTIMRMASEPIAVRKSPKLTAPVAAYLQARSTASLIKCDKKGWCKVRSGGITGWTEATGVWGVAEKPQCVAPRVIP